MTALRVELRVGAETVGQASDWEALHFMEQVNTVTGGTITVPAGSEVLELMKLAPATAEPVGLLFTDDDSGHAVPVFFHKVIDSSAAQVQVPFKLDLAMLNEVPAWPEPDTPSSPWTNNACWELTGDAVAATVQFVLTHGGPFGPADYQHFTSVTAGSDAGVEVSYRARMQPSLDVVRETVQGAAVVQARLEANSKRLFVRAPLTRSQVVFSPELHTLDEWDIGDEMPAANDGWGAGTGEGAGRSVVRVQLNSPTWPRKRGMLIDRPTLDAGIELTNAIYAALAHDGPSMTATAVDGGEFVYGRDFLLGDTVTVEVPSGTYQLPVTSVETTAEAGGAPVRRVQLGEAPLDTRPDLKLLRLLLRRYGLSETA